MQPDLLCLSKGLTGGFLPLAAVLATQAIYDGFLDDSRERAFLHSHSYTGNPLACAAALATLAIFRDDDVLARNRVTAARMARTGRAVRRRIAHVADVRQAGMIVAIELTRDGDSRTPFDPAAAHRPARLPRGTGTWRGAAPAWRHAVLDAAVLHRRRTAGAAGAGDRRRDRGGRPHARDPVHVELPLAAGTDRRCPEHAANHLVRVLRLRDGDACVLFNGDGHDYPRDAWSKSASARCGPQVGAGQPVDNESPLRISLLQGIARGEKMDLILQKATELGVASVHAVVLATQRSEARRRACRQAAGALARRGGVGLRTIRPRPRAGRRHAVAIGAGACSVARGRRCG